MGEGTHDAVGARARVADLLGEHVGHQVRRGPHALADLRPAAQPAGESDVHVVVLVRGEPALRPHLRLANHRAGLHRGVDLVAGAVEEPGVDEREAPGRGPDALREVQRGAALLVHQPDLHGERGQAEHLLDEAEHLVGERDLVGPVHLRLHHVHRALPRVACVAAGRQVVLGRRDGHQRVEESLGDRHAVRAEHGVGGHQVADVAHEHQRPAGQRERGAVGADDFPVRGQAAGEGPAALGDLRGQIAAHQAEPVAVGGHLVLGVHGGDRVLEVHDRGHRGFEDDVCDARLVLSADDVAAVDHDEFDVQAVVPAGRSMRGDAASPR